MSEYYLTKSDELYHYGVKGQQWGRRQYQNTDGSLTELGRQHYGYGPARSLRGTGYRALSKVYGLNERFYDRTGNKTMASMNRSAKNDMLKKANAADQEKAKNRNSEEHKARVKKAIKIGAAIAGTALVAYGAYKVSQVVRNRRAGQNLAATAKFQETLSKRYNDVIGNMNGRDSDISKKYFNKNQALKTNLERTQSQLQSQNARETTERFKSNLANRYNNVVGNMNGRDSAKAKRYYDARKALTAPAERAAANAARAQKLRDTATKVSTSTRNAFSSANNRIQSSLKDAAKKVMSGSDRRKLAEIRSELGSLNSRGVYYEARLNAPGLSSEAKITAAREYNKVLQEQKSLQNAINSIINRQRG